tara:strand:- start:690 stop:1475 length:786 start_codon:yes stop_codon:yes gene_type:complete
MIYITGSNGLIGTRFKTLCCGVGYQTISYRDVVPENLFETHEKSCLIHLGWSSTTRTKDVDQVEKDVVNSQKLFNYYLDKNPNGKIIFVSTAGNMHQHRDNRETIEKSIPHPLSLYSQTKLRVEKILEQLNCKTVVLRVSNVWGSKVDKNRVNGLVDKLRSAVDTDRAVEIYANLDTEVDLIHIDDLILLMLEVINIDLDKNHELFLVGGQSVSICDIINKVSKMGSLNLKVNQKGMEKSFVNIRPTKVEKTFNWKRGYYL